MGIDFTKMYEGLKASYSNYQKEKGTVKAEDIANKILWLADKTTVENLTSIFNQAANKDGNKELTEAEFEEAIMSKEFKELVEAHQNKLNAAALQAKDLENGMPFGIENDNEKTDITPAGTPRDHVVVEKGEEFANEIWDPMKKMANDALKYMQENNGTLEKFTFTGFPNGVKLINIGPSISFIDDSNDTFSITDGQPHVTRNADSIQAFVVFEFAGETYKLFSDNTAENLEPWGNPSYNEEELDSWGANSSTTDNEPNVVPNVEPNVVPNVEPNVVPNVVPNVQSQETPTEKSVKKNVKE